MGAFSTRTATATPSPRVDSYQALLCPTGGSTFWACGSPSFYVGCCPSDPCRDGYCHDDDDDLSLDDSHVSSTSLSSLLFRRGDGRNLSTGGMDNESGTLPSTVKTTTTITYTLMYLTEGAIGTFSAVTFSIISALPATATATTATTTAVAANSNVSATVEESVEGSATPSIATSLVIGKETGKTRDSATAASVDEAWVSVSMSASASASASVFASSRVSQRLTGWFASDSASAPPQSCLPACSSSSSRNRLLETLLAESKLTSSAASISVTNTVSQAVAVASNPLFISPKPSKPAASVSAPVKPSSQGVGTKPTAVSGGKLTAPSSTGQLTSSSTSLAPAVIYPPAAPASGKKKSGRAITSMTLGVIAAAFVILLLVYCCVSRRRRSGSHQAKSSRRWKRSRVSEGAEVDVIKIKTGDNDVQSPMTPGGAKLEEQRGRMLKEKSVTGFRALGMTAATATGETEKRLVPELTVPTPAMRASEHPASYLALDAGEVHPAYRDITGGGTKSEVDLSSLARRSIISPGGARFYSDNSNASAAEPAETDRPSRASWEPGNDVINVVRAQSLSVESGAVTTAHESSEKPKFDETTARWATIVSPTTIGQAVSMSAETNLSVQDQKQNPNDGSTATSTENEVTSPVEDGRITRPIRRNVYRGFEEIVHQDGTLK